MTSHLPNLEPNKEMQSVSNAFGLRRLLKFLKEEYSNPSFLIGQLGASFDRSYNDAERISFLESHFNQMARAIEDYGLSQVLLFSLVGRNFLARALIEK